MVCDRECFWPATAAERMERGDRERRRKRGGKEEKDTQRERRRYTDTCIEIDTRGGWETLLLRCQKSRPFALHRAFFFAFQTQLLFGFALVLI